MLKSIKSLYFIQYVYTYVDDAKIIKYNKSLHNIINININNYKYFSGKYIIYESNGTGKEYDGYNDILIFEGEYKNGQRNGKGKEYDNYGKLSFEGEYLNGKRNGKGKEYYEDEKLKIKFEGLYLNDKEWIGTRYTYDGDGIIIYKLNNNNSKGKEYDYNNNLIFEGEYLNGKRNGKGKEYNYKGDLEFEGEYKNDLKWTGKGYDQMNNIIYEIKDGKGLIKKYHLYMNKLSYEAEYLNGKRFGKGKEYNVFGILIFEGEYLFGKRNGKGKEYYDWAYYALRVNIYMVIN